MAAKCAHSGTQRNEDGMESNGTGSEPENDVVPAIRLGSVTATVTVPRGRAQQGAKRPSLHLSLNRRMTSVAVKSCRLDKSGRSRPVYLGSINLEEGVPGELPENIRRQLSDAEAAKARRLLATIRPKVESRIRAKALNVILSGVEAFQGGTTASAALSEQQVTDLRQVAAMLHAAGRAMESLVSPSTVESGPEIKAVGDAEPGGAT